MEKKRNLWVIPTDKPSRLMLRHQELFFFKDDDSIPKGTPKNQNIYITNLEEIKEGDWVYCTERKLFGKAIEIQLAKFKSDTSMLYFEINNEEIWCKLFNCKKIILTTDPELITNGVQAIDDEFLEWFVKNPSCEEVLVTNLYGNFNPIKCEYKIIIPSEKPKQDVINYSLNAFKVPKEYFSKEEPCTCTDECFGYLTKTCKRIEEEIWRDIPSYEGLYQVSNFGNVKSLKRYVKGKVKNRLQKENILSKRLVGDIGNQYYAVTLCNNKDRKQIKISVLVAMAFLNHTPNGYVGFTVDHIDNNPLNNTVNNLQVITKRENSSKDKKGISKYTGVTFNKKSNKWRSQIWINGKNKTLGSFDDELEAHRAYQKELQQYLKSQ